jgi:P-type Mg2+ transporter
MTPTEVLDNVSSSDKGLSAQEAAKRLAQYGPNTISSKKFNAWLLLWRQITGNPLVLILAAATTISYFMGQHTSAYYIFVMILLSVGLGFWNEFAAERTVCDLLKRVSLSAVVQRDGEKLELPVVKLTVGDIVYLTPGTIIPADMRLIETDNLEVDQSTLTGESKTVFKVCHAIDAKPGGLNDYANIGFMSTIVTSGGGKGVVLSVGKDTEFGKIAHEASFIKPETDFQRGLRHFGDLIVKVILTLAVGIFAVNWLLGHELIDSLLFALAIAVGLTPELLPIIVTISLSHGAGKLAKKHVICKQLVAIENLGNMDVLCTDKTGTLTEGHIVVTDTINSAGENTPDLLRLGIICNSAIHHHKVIGNAIDVALWDQAHKNGVGYGDGVKKVFEEPFDYEKRAMFCVATKGKTHTLIAKGSPDAILQHCANAQAVQAAHRKVLELNLSGLRLVAIATKTVTHRANYTWTDMADLHFEGFITFLDVPKKSVDTSIHKMENLGVSIKIVTGDSDLVTKYVCHEVGLPITGAITGEELMKLDEQKQLETVQKFNIFARVTPTQKLHIIELLRQAGHTVGYMGDGINDIPALHSADVGISVNTAVDVAKDAAPIVLLRKGLDVIADGIVEGRSTFSNTMKYILMGTSSNFGNMFSAAGASFFLPFLPMSPSQILLNNSLYDVSQISIPTDNVDLESLRKPRHWDIKFIKYYMLFFGPISSAYDFLTFGMMIYIFHAAEPMFQTGWFVESLATQVLVVFIIRTSRRPFWKSRPSKWLTMTCLGVVSIGALLPYTPLGNGLGFVPLPPLYFLCLAALVGTYLLLVVKLRSVFLKRFSL